MGGDGVACHRVWRRCAGIGRDGVVAPDHSVGASRAGVRQCRARSDTPPGRRTAQHRAVAAIKQALEKLVDPLTRGDPESPLRWTCKSRAKLTAVLSKAGWRVSSTTVSRLLHELGYSLQSVRKSLEGTTHPDRDEQFEHINTKADDFCNVVSQWSRSTPRRKSWWVNSRTVDGSGNRRGIPRNHWCMIFPRTRPAKRFRMASMTWGATKHG